MTSEPRYKTPQAARKAVTDRLRTAAESSPWKLTDLQRQFAYDQLVERLYRLDPNWVIKGATALLARRVSVRHTLDIDLYHAGAIAEVERMVREAVALDIADWMRFELGESVQLEAAGAQARRIPVSSYIGAKVWAEFRIDIVAEGIRMSGTPDFVPPLTGVEINGRERHQWRAYPIPDHIADKVFGIVERHKDRPSTRFKDLIDLVAIRHRCLVDAAATQDSLDRQAQRRGVELPEQFDVPDPELWKRGYAAEAKRTVGLAALTLEDAMDVAKPFLDPLLEGTAEGTWDPETGRWS